MKKTDLWREREKWYCIRTAEGWENASLGKGFRTNMI